MKLFASHRSARSAEMDKFPQARSTLADSCSHGDPRIDRSSSNLHDDPTVRFRNTTDKRRHAELNGSLIWKNARRHAGRPRNPTKTGYRAGRRPVQHAPRPSTKWRQQHARQLVCASPLYDLPVVFTSATEAARKSIRPDDTLRPTDQPTGRRWQSAAVGNRPGRRAGSVAAAAV